tara:strand:- start:1579 stop:1977 length:399 start_codon:yes stop_codon:yes gene_type:complete
LNCCFCKNKELASEEISGINVLYCEDCQGTWYTNDVILSMKEKEEVFSLPDFANNKYSTNTKDSPLSCPEDQSFLQSYLFHNVEIDVCPECSGVWLEKKEREKILSNAIQDLGGRVPIGVMEFLGYLSYLLK